MSKPVSKKQMAIVNQVAGHLLEPLLEPLLGQCLDGVRAEALRELLGAETLRELLKPG